MKNYTPGQEAQMTNREKAIADKEASRKIKPGDTSKMYGLRYKNPDTTVYVRTADQRDNKRPEIELMHGECVNVEPKRK